MPVPILNASGCLDALTAPDVARELDAFVTKTITPAAARGQPAAPDRRDGARDAELDRPPGAGHRRVPRRTRCPPWRPRAFGVWVSVGGFSAADFAGICERLDERDDVEVLELNLSCPNVDEAPESAAEIVAACRASTSKPLYAKLSPATWDIGETARAVVAAGADGLSLVNTIRGLALDPVTLQPKLGRGSGGYSGPALRPIALACVAAAAKQSTCRSSAWVGSARGSTRWSSSRPERVLSRLAPILFADPAAPGRIRAELDAEAAARGYADPLDAQGVAIVHHRKTLQIAAKRFSLTVAPRIARLVAPWSRRRLRHRHRPDRSTSGWRLSSARTTSAFGARS